jgi:methionyl-tRNA formyltransferase
MTKLKVVILASSVTGTAAHHLPYLIESKVCDVSMVVLSRNVIFRRSRHYKRKIQKIFKIGLLGSLNGVRMRKWYSALTKKYIRIRNLEETCAHYKVPFFTTPTINCEDTAGLLRQASADVGISLGNGYIGKKIFNIPLHGMINIHHEILPDYQNAQSIIWQIYNNSIFTGYTIHKIDSSIDTGDIIFKEQVPIEFKGTLPDTVANTSVKLLQSSARGLIHVLGNFKKLMVCALPQGKGNHYTTPTIWQYIKIEQNFRHLKKGKVF